MARVDWRFTLSPDFENEASKTATSPKGMLEDITSNLLSCRFSISSNPRICTLSSRRRCERILPVSKSFSKQTGWVSGKESLKLPANAPLPAEGSRKRSGDIPLSFSVSEMVFIISGGV